jgi:MOSC domain-containing protein YiiM
MPKEGIFARVICSGLVRAGDPVKVKVQIEGKG